MVEYSIDTYLFYVQEHLAWYSVSNLLFFSIIDTNYQEDIFDVSAPGLIHKVGLRPFKETSSNFSINMDNYLSTDLNIDEQGVE